MLAPAPSASPAIVKVAVAAAPEAARVALPSTTSCARKVTAPVGAAPLPETARTVAVNWNESAVAPLEGLAETAVALAAPVFHSVTRL